MKKLGIIFLTAALILTLCACGSGDASTGDDEIIESTDGPAAILTTDSSDNNTAETDEPDADEPDGDTPDTQDEAEETVSQEPEEIDPEEDTPDEPSEPSAPASSDAPAASTSPGIPAVTQPEPDPEPSEPEPADEPEQNTPDPKSVAESYIDKSLSGLVAAIGQPNSSDYAPSCLGDGEDGELFYNGFTVYTYREGNEETVTYVE